VESQARIPTRESKMTNTSPDEIRAEVKKFWDFFSCKSETQFAEMYIPSATIFAADARRMELARLMLVRRARELFGAASSVGASTRLMAEQSMRPGIRPRSLPP